MHSGFLFGINTLSGKEIDQKVRCGLAVFSFKETSDFENPNKLNPYRLN
jgi:hypothetical protein